MAKLDPKLPEVMEVRKTYADSSEKVILLKAEPKYFKEIYHIIAYLKRIPDRKIC